MQINDNLTSDLAFQATLYYSQNPGGCELVMGNKCPSVCGGRWMEWMDGGDGNWAWFVSPSISITCKGNLLLDNRYFTLSNLFNDVYQIYIHHYENFQ